MLTRSPQEVEEVLLHLIKDLFVTVLGVNGGDGTLNSVLNALVSLLEKGLVAPDQVPLLMPLNGGTYNIASRAMGTKGNPISTLKSFYRRFSGLRIGEINTVDLPVLRIQLSDNRLIYGMVFGSEVISNSLELCAQYGSGYKGLLKLLGKGAAGAFLSTSFIEEHGWRLKANNDVVEVDGKTLHVNAVAASTIDLSLVKGFVCALTASKEENQFHARLIRADRPVQLARLIPYLLFEMTHPLIEDVYVKDYIVTHGAFTIDGELYPHSGPVRVSLSPWKFKLVAFK